MFCTLTGFVALFWALDKGGVVLIALLQFDQPVINFIIVATLLSETLSATMLLALCLILWRIFVASGLMRLVLTQDSALSLPCWRARAIAVCDRLKTSR